MNSITLNGTTLRALRQHLFFSVDEAAELIGCVSPRSWQYWESGDRTIPADVIDKIYHLCEYRDSKVRMTTNEINELDVENEIILIWYSTLEDWLSLDGRDPMLWRPQCSVIAELCATFWVSAVQFDKDSYLEWLGKLKDSELMRNEWARTKIE